MVKIEKEKFSTTTDFGHSNAKFCGYLYYNHECKGTIWKYNSGGYCFNEDFNRKIHNKETRPTQVVSNTLSDLKELVNGYYEYMEGLK